MFYDVAEVAEVVRLAREEVATNMAAVALKYPSLPEVWGTADSLPNLLGRCQPPCRCLRLDQKQNSFCEKLLHGN